jgi:DNA polymerase III subunit delta'
MRAMDRKTWPPAERHPHAAAVLGPAAQSTSPPSHSYLFHGPAGAGKRELAREFAAALLAEGASSPDTVAERVWRESHPDLTWVRASGAAEMLVGDIDEPVVAAASMTPFESARRVFVIEGAERMNDQAANRLLKTLEEPAPFAHLVLITDRLQDVLPTIVSRCQRVRFDPPPPAAIEEGLAGVDAERARACARLALGDAGLARALAGEGGAAVRAAAETFVRSSLAGETAAAPWKGLLEAARGAGSLAGEQAERRVEDELELIPSKERKRHQREGAEAQRRVERRARTETLALGLRLAELWLRDLLCLQLDAVDLIHAVDRREQLETDAARIPAGVLPQAIELTGAARLSLAVNVSEELALEALAYELADLGGG